MSETYAHRKTYGHSTRKYGWDSSAAKRFGCEQGSESRDLIRNIRKDTYLAANSEVKLVPLYPFNWLGRLPLTMQTLGAPWLANVVYPTIYDYNMAEVMRDYLARFFHIDLTYEQALMLLDETVNF